MIEGVTKPFESGRVPLTPDQVRAAATVYLAGMRALFDHFDPLTGGDSNLALDVPFAGEPDVMSAVAERGSGSLEVIAPDSQWHSYGLRGEAVWRHDGMLIDSLRRSDAERVLPPRDGTDAEKLAHFHRLAAEAETLSEYEPTDGPVDEEEVGGLFALLMRGRPSADIDNLEDL
ncbi:MAG TPA: hypothetical protein VLI54_00865 [Bacillota bacterium]|nr:hypothetical protein [Bacillota bacterium]